MTQHIDHDSYVELQELFDGRYRKIADCTDIVNGTECKMDAIVDAHAMLREEVRVGQAKTNTRLNILIGILTAIATPIIGICVKLLFG